MANSKIKLAENILDVEKIERVPTRFGFGEGLVLAGKENPNVVALCADISESTRAAEFMRAFPERFIEMGIAEQNMLNVATGLALAGKIPFVSTYAVFSPGLNWCQLRGAVQNNANVKIAGAHAGISVGPDGMSHQALEDIAITRCLPGLIVLAPCDSIETRKATLAAARYQGPVYIRFAREKTPVFTTEETPFEIGKAEIFWTPESGEPDVSIIACGPLVHSAILAADELEKEGIKVEVVNNHTIKPVDKKTIIESVGRSKAVVTVEEHRVVGGMGSAVAELLAGKSPVPIEFVGMQDVFGESGEPDELLKKFKMTTTDIAEAVQRVLKRKN